MERRDNMDCVTELMAIMRVKNEPQSRDAVEVNSIVAKNIFNLIKEMTRETAFREKTFYITIKMLLRDEKHEQYENELGYALERYADNPKYWDWYWTCFLVGVEMKHEMLDEICENINKISHQYKALSGISANIVHFHDLEVSIKW